jgi:hypothetical protein
MDGATTAPDVIAGEASSSVERPLARVPLVLNKRSFDWVTNRISGAVENPTPRWWWVAFATTSGLALFGLLCIGYQISTGVGVWGLNSPVGWAWDITNFVFWIGIGHAGTLISAILFLLRQKWRTSINRSAEAMTLFAVICAAIFPGIHVGRVWMAWFLAPVPTQYGIWPNFRSPLLWDVFAVSTYFTVSVLFWYTGLVPDSGHVCAIERRSKDQEILLWIIRARLGADQTGTGAIMRWHTCFWPVFPRRSCFPCTASFRSTSRLRVIPTWHTTISRPTSSLAPSLADSRWC